MMKQHIRLKRPATRRLRLVTLCLLLTASLSGCGVFCGAAGGSGGGIAGGCGAGMRF